jgi:hypothetical protein
VLGEEGLASFVEKARELAPLPFIHELLWLVAQRSEEPLIAVFMSIDPVAHSRSAKTNPPRPQG